MTSQSNRVLGLETRRAYNQRVIGKSGPTNSLPKCIILINTPIYRCANGSNRHCQYGMMDSNNNT